MKAITNNELSLFAVRTLKLIGVLLILIFLVDFATLLFPFNPLNQTWQISFTTQLVGSGIIFLVGLALLFTGYWRDPSVADIPNSRPSIGDIRFWAILSSALFGILFLILSPLHILNINQASAQAVTQIDQKAYHDLTEVQNQLNSPQTQAQLQQQQEQVKAQIDYLLKNEQQYNQVLQNRQIPQQMKDLLKQSKAHPQEIDQLVQKQLQANVDNMRNQAIKQIQQTQGENKQQATQEAWRSGIRIGLTSLLLAIGCLATSWLGLGILGFFQPERRKYTTD